MKYPAYPAYTAAGPNGASFPTPWPVQRLRFHIQSNPVRSEVAHLAPETLVTFVPMEAVGEWGGMDTSAEREVGDVSNGYTYFANGDVVIAKITPCFENGKGAIAQGLSNGVAFGTTELHVIRPNESLSNRWVFYLTMSHLFRKWGEAEMFGAGGQKRVPEDFIRNLRVGIPSLDEQEQIADFLDWRTAQIDALIAKKQALLDRMREEQDAVVTGAVTKGLAPNQPTKPSGAPWLGDVPRHWVVKRLKWAVTFQRGHDLPADDRNEGDVPLVSSSGISAVHDTAVAQAPGIVTGRYGTIGVFHLIEQDYWPLNTTLYSIDLHGNNPVFLCALLENLAPLFLLNAKKSAVPGVDRNDLHQIEVALPPREEQDRIADHLTKYEQKIKAVRTRVSDAIERLTEYRAALITAAVTGQIDVRGVKVPVPV